MRIKRAASLAFAFLLCLVPLTAFSESAFDGYLSSDPRLFEDPQLRNDSFAAAFPPEHYGGWYLDKDGSMILLIVEKYKDLYDDYPPEIKIRYVKYALAELVAVRRRVSVLMDENPEIVKACGIGGLGIDVGDNCIYVEMKDPSDEIISKFKSTISNSEMIVFVQREPDRPEPLDDDVGDVMEATPDCSLE